MFFILRPRTLILLSSRLGLENSSAITGQDLYIVCHSLIQYNYLDTFGFVQSFLLNVEYLSLKFLKPWKR